MAGWKLNRSGKKGKEVRLARWHEPGALRNIFVQHCIVRGVKEEVGTGNRRYAK